MRGGGPWKGRRFFSIPTFLGSNLVILPIYPQPPAYVRTLATPPPLEVRFRAWAPRALGERNVNIAQTAIGMGSFIVGGVGVRLRNPANLPRRPA